MILTAVLIAPAVMGAATRVERRLGPSAGGWVAALPVGFAIAVLTVLLDAGPRAASTLALSAAVHVVAQVIFAVAATAVLAHRGRSAGLLAGAIAYLGATLGLAFVPDWLAVTLAVPALIIAPRVMPVPSARAAAPHHWSTTAASCLACSAVVGGAVLAAQQAGPVVAGAVAAFPTASAVLAVASSSRTGSVAATSVFAGLVRSLPCYLTFCLAAWMAIPVLGLVGLPLVVLACGGTGWIMWRTVPRAAQPTPSQILTPAGRRSAAIPAPASATAWVVLTRQSS